MKTILTFLFIPILSAASFGQDLLNVNRYAEPGKVYSKCRFIQEPPRSIEKQEAKVLKFIGTQWEVTLDTIYKDDNEDWDYQHVLVKEASEEWRYNNRMDRNCLSANPNNCISITYKEFSEEYQNVYFGETDSFKTVEVERVVRAPEVVLVDSVCIDLEVEENKSRLVLLDEKQNILYVKMLEGWWTDWREIICSSPGPGTHNSMIIEMQRKLKADGFYKGPIHGKMDKGVKNALVKFQKANGLPVGQLNRETLDAFGIRY